MRRPIKLTLYLAVLAGLVWGAAQIPLPRNVLTARTGPALAAAKTWGYQLQGVAPLAIRPEIDLMVVDYSRDGTDLKAWRPDEVQALQTRPDGTRRTVLAYMSIGEAETYRFYWWPHWRVVAPAWLGAENKEWKGNFGVRYWNRAWQRLIVDAEPKLLTRLGELHLTWLKPYIDRILEAGFDGVYLDRVDAFGIHEAKRPGAELEMVRFVRAISAYAKARKPGFLVVPQNGEELLKHVDYRKAIDGVAKEDLLFGAEIEGKPNDPSEVARSAAFLTRAKSEGLAVLVVEYVTDPDQQALALIEMQRLGFLPLLAGRELNRPPALPPPVTLPATVVPKPTPNPSTPETPLAPSAATGPAKPPAPEAATAPPAARAATDTVATPKEPAAAPRAILIEPLIPPAPKR